jgi:pimeloyl-ACP methyl ester carboxylesterase
MLMFSKCALLAIAVASLAGLGDGVRLWTMQARDAIFTVVSRPGPAEQRVLARLPGCATQKRRLGGDVALRTIESTPATSSGAPTLVFLPGRGHSAAMWAPYIAAFRERAPVIAFDLPGFGHSGATSAPPRSQEEALSFFASPVEAALVGAGPLVIVGHSLGGLVACELALRGKLELAGLALIGSMGLSPYVTPRARAYLRVGPERLARIASRLRTSGPGVSHAAKDADMAALRHELHAVPGGRPLAKRAFDLLVPLFGDAISRRDRLAELALPLLLVWGDHDEAFPLPIAMAARALAPRAELEVLHAGHSPHLEVPDLVLARLESFIDAVSGAPRPSFARTGPA